MVAIGAVFGRSVSALLGAAVQALLVQFKHCMGGRRERVGDGHGCGAGLPVMHPQQRPYYIPTSARYAPQTEPAHTQKQRL